MAPSPISMVTPSGAHLSKKPSDKSDSFLPLGEAANKERILPGMSPHRSSFEDTFNFLIEDNLEGNGGLGLELASMRTWLKTVLTYNVQQGTPLRGQLVEMMHQGLVHDAPEKMVHLARVLGWCVEIVRAAFVVIDDFTSDGRLRQGRPCWHHVDKIGVNAIIDGIMLYHVAYQLVRKYFEDLPCYPELMDLFLGVQFKIAVGQSVAYRTNFRKNKHTKSGEESLEGGPFENYTFQQYYSIVRDKYSYSTCYLPVALAMSLAGISRSTHRALWDNVKNVTQDIGYLLKVQEDYFDCFGNDRQLEGRNGNIREGKCTWLFVTAKNLLLGPISREHQQYALLKENYGKIGNDNVAAVQKLYRELGLPKLFQECQNSMSRSIIKSIKQLNHTELETALLHFFVVYK